MSNGCFILDGVDYNVGVKSLKRNFEVADTDSSGRTEDWKMHRYLVGTFYNYTLEVFVNGNDYASYNAFYDTISSPVASHSMTFPYGDSTISFEAYCTKGSDSLIHKSPNLWDGLSVNFIAMSPQRSA